MHGSGGCLDAMVKELENNVVHSHEPQLGLLVTRRSSTGWGMLTRGICGTRERNSWILLREIASAAVLIAPETCSAQN